MAAEPPRVVTENAGKAVLTVLRHYGIDVVFGIPGTHSLEFYRHLRALDIRAVTTRHEQGAGYAADGWSAHTGLPGVVITTSGPGLLNVLSSAGSAFCESRPLIILSPGAPEGAEFADVGALHETKDPTGAAGAVVEWSRRVHSAGEAVAAVHDAFELFRHGRPRPVHIEIPLNVLEGPSEVSDEELLPRPSRPAARAEEQAVTAAAAALGGAKRPVILAGGGSLRAGADLTRLAELLAAPVVTTLNGKAAIPESHPLSLGSELRLAEARAICEDADVLLVIGSKVGEAELWFEKLAPTGSVIRVDILAGQLDTNVEVDIGLVGDSAAVVPQLLAELTALTGRAERPAPRLGAVRDRLREQARAISPPCAALTELLAAAVPPSAIIGGDSSQITYFGTASFIPNDRPRSLLYTPAYATLGYGLPASIGAKLAAPDRPVICVVGDGALMFAVQELATAVEQGIDLVVVCVDNGGYGEIRQNEIDRDITPIGVDLVQPDWPMLATAFGGTGRRITDARELAPTLRDAIAAKGLQLLHVPMALVQQSPA